MDEDRPSISPHDLYVVPTRDQVERLSAHPLRESSVVVYCGNEQQVSEGFAVALRAMGVEANILQADVALLATSTNREDS
jgi:hypothetical protein